MDPNHNFAVFENSTIQNANLYFSSWAALVVSLLLATSYFEITHQRQDDIHLYHWVGFATAGLIVMCDTARLWNAECDEQDDGGAAAEDDHAAYDDTDNTARCNRTGFGLALGAFSFMIGYSIAWIQLRLILAQYVSIIFFVAWCFGIAYLTFGEGPGTDVGTIFFASWASLLYILCIAAPAIFEAVPKVLGLDTTAPCPATEMEAIPNTTNSKQHEGGGMDTKVGGKNDDD